MTPNPPERDPHLWHIRAVRDLLWMAAALVCLWLIYWAWPVFMPAFAALVLAYLIDPLITYCDRRWQLPRVVTISLLLALVVLGTLATAVWLVPIVIRQSLDFLDNLPDYIERGARAAGIDAQAWAEKLNERLSPNGENSMVTMEKLWASSGEAMSVVVYLFETATYVAICLFVIPFYWFLFAWHFRSMKDWCWQFVPHQQRDRTIEILQKMDEAIGAFFRGRLLIAVIVGALFSLGWWAAGVPYWFLIGMATGLLNIIPYAAVMGWPAVILLAYLDGGGSFLSVVVWPSVVYCVVQFMDGWVLTPLLQSHEVNMSAATILLVVFLGGAIGGIWGMLLGIPVAACIKILMEEFLFPRWRQWAESH